MKYVCVCGYVYDPAVGDPETVLLPELPGRRSRKIGSVLTAVWARTLSRPSNKNTEPGETGSIPFLPVLLFPYGQSRNS